MDLFVSGHNSLVYHFKRKCLWWIERWIVAGKSFHMRARQNRIHHTIRTFPNNFYDFKVIYVIGLWSSLCLRSLVNRWTGLAILDAFFRSLSKDYFIWIRRQFAISFRLVRLLSSYDIDRCQRSCWVISLYILIINFNDSPHWHIDVYLAKNRWRALKVFLM